MNITQFIFPKNVGLNNEINLKKREQTERKLRVKIVSLKQNNHSLTHTV